MIKRYNYSLEEDEYSSYVCMEQHKDGAYVLYDDHVDYLKDHDRTKCPNCENCITNLRDDKKRLEEENEELKKQIRTLHNTIERITQ